LRFLNRTFKYFSKKIAIWRFEKVTYYVSAINLQLFISSTLILNFVALCFPNFILPQHFLFELQFLKLPSVRTEAILGNL
jgi:hypothetical protein